jgi:hypothetical protein
MRAFAGILTAMALLAAAPVSAQIDDTKRLLLEGGGERALGNPGPAGAYGFWYLNKPDAVGPGSAWRLALAPVYLDTELGLPGLLGSRTDVGLGFSGGGYAFSQQEVVRGDRRRGESFIGHGGGPSLSFYPKIANIGPVPLSGVFHFSAVYTDYQNTSRTDSNFVVPPDEWTGTARGGLRLGGQEPGLGRGPALELSAWYEARIRDRPGTYGYNHDRVVRRDINLYWMRFLFMSPAEGGPRGAGGFSLGGGDRLGRLAAYRLGGMLTQTSEFPLILPGYFPQEIAARKFAHVWTKFGLPIDVSSRYYLNLVAAGASVTPIGGTDPGGPLHAGFGLGLEFAPRKAALHGELTYGYSPTAIRGERRGAHSIALTAEVDFLTPEKGPARRANTRQQGLGWLLGR